MVMMGDFGGWLFWPFGLAFAGAMAVVMILFLVFWIWMIVDCAKRKFRSNVEKVVWLIIVVFAHWVGALAYLIIIKLYNKTGLFSGESIKGKKRKK